MRAAVLRQTGDAKVDIVDNMELEDIGPGMVRVAIKATGVCHSDLSAMTGVIPQPTGQFERISTRAKPPPSICTSQARLIIAIFAGAFGLLKLVGHVG